MIRGFVHISFPFDVLSADEYQVLINSRTVFSESAATKSHGIGIHFEPGIVYGAEFDSKQHFHDTADGLAPSLWTVVPERVRQALVTFTYNQPVDANAWQHSLRRSESDVNRKSKHWYAAVACKTCNENGRRHLLAVKYLGFGEDYNSPDRPFVFNVACDVCGVRSGYGGDDIRAFPMDERLTNFVDLF